MILQAVPTEDYDDETPKSSECADDAALYGRPQFGLDLDDGPPRSKPGSGKASMLADPEEARRQVYRFTMVVSVCCCLGMVGVGASLALLRRYGAESEANAAAAGAPLLVVFSYAPNTDAALAWLVAKLLAGAPLSASAGGAGTSATLFAPRRSRRIAGGPFLPDGELVGIWRPAHHRGNPSQLRALAHGGVAGMLRRVHGLGPPRVGDLTWPAGSAPQGGGVGALAKEAVPEMDAFLAIRVLLEAEEAAAPPAEPPPAERGPGAAARRRPAAADLVLLSHPHHVPYLTALARASGFRALGLEPSVYGAVPWFDFDCDSLGYPKGASSQAGVDRELERLRGYVQALRSGDAQHFAKLRPVVSAANATLTFHRCVAGLMTAAAASAASGAAGTSPASEPQRVAAVDAAVGFCGEGP